MFGLITRKKHEAALALMAKANVDLEQDVRTERETVGRLVAANRALREELATLKAARAKANANLKQFRDQKVGKVCEKCGGTHVQFRNGGDCMGPPMPSARPPHGMMG